MEIPHFLADTWWYALTNRLNDNDYLKLVKKRSAQGFTAAQIVVGIPPEVNIDDNNAKSIYGTAFDKEGKVNYKYLEFAKRRIEIMNQNNLIAIIYGAWGDQINWIGTKNMMKWWNQLIKVFDNLNVIYCLTGEIDIGCNTKNDKQKRIIKWEKVLKDISKKTNKPIIVHTMPGNTSFSLIKNQKLLSANTFQSGHTENSKKEISKIIRESKMKFPGVPVINLEPYYEGIHGKFYEKDQIDIFKLCIKQGVHAICYGAQGIWNVGDGKFLSHWGTQTFEEALTLKTPEIISKCYREITENKE